MQYWWIKFCCFLTGFNIDEVSSGNYILFGSVSARTLKIYTSSILVICVIWFFVGFFFADKYLNISLTGSIISAVVLCLVIIQIERQIILAVHKNWGVYTFRFLIGLCMATISSTFITQLIFKGDIEQQKIFLTDAKVDKVLPYREAELIHQITLLDSSIKNKEIAQKNIENEIRAIPVIREFPIHNDDIPLKKSKEIFPNPKVGLLLNLHMQIKNLRNEKSKNDSILLTLRPAIEKEIESKVGFLDELRVMFLIISGSRIALAVLLLWFVFFLSVELFTLMVKIGEK